MSEAYKQLIRWGTLREFVSLTDNTAESGRPWFDEQNSEKHLLATFKLLKETRVPFGQAPTAITNYIMNSDSSDEQKQKNIDILCRVMNQTTSANSRIISHIEWLSNNIKSQQKFQERMEELARDRRRRQASESSA